MKILITGGAGFIGSSAAAGLALRHPEWKIVAIDNLRRRGSELNLPRLRAAGVDFVHGDVRDLADLSIVDEVQVIVECSAEPSVLAGVGESPDYVIKANLLGAYHCLEVARRHDAQFVFLSTSRVYPLASLVNLAIFESETRFELADQQPVPGVSGHGISEDMPLFTGARTVYGATKLAAELLIHEYRESYGLRTVVNRCGVIAGPWQMGKVDQGVFTFWMLAHVFQRPLSYIGFGGGGKQVRDLLHVEDLVDLVDRQLADPSRWNGWVGNVGGGSDCSLSLQEATTLCAEITGHETRIIRQPEPRPGDVPIYISDCRRLYDQTDWRPRFGTREIMCDIRDWIADHEQSLRQSLDS